MPTEIFKVAGCKHAPADIIEKLGGLAAYVTADESAVFILYLGPAFCVLGFDNGELKTISGDCTWEELADLRNAILEELHS